MAHYYFASCKATAQFKDASRQARAYVDRKFRISPVGCCRPNHKKLTREDTAIVVCNNCAAIIEENTEAAIEFLWQVIDNDPDFPFPDYRGENMTVQDCWIAFERRDVQDAVRSLLRKMNIGIVELEENFEKTKFCGVNLLSPCTESNAALAHKRYVEQFPHMFTPMEPEEQVDISADIVSRSGQKRSSAIASSARTPSTWAAGRAFTCWNCCSRRQNETSPHKHSDTEEEPECNS